MKTTRYLILSVIILLLSVSAVGAQNSQLTLRQAADPGFMVGAAVEPTILSGDAAYNQTLAREYNTLVAENAMKFRSLSPNQGEYNFTAADTLVSYAQANGMQVRGHTLVWHAALPTWLINGSFTRDQMIDILRTHIYTVVGHYKGQVAVWDVVNEAVVSPGYAPHPCGCSVLGRNIWIWLSALRVRPIPTPACFTMITVRKG